jgi:hypothetical protein
MAALAAYVILDNNGVVVKCHNGGGATPNAPTQGAGDLEKLINGGFLQKREVPLDGGRVLIVLEHP